MKGKLSQWGIETIESNLILFVRTLVLEFRCSGVFEAKQPSASPSKSPSNSPLKSSGVSPSRSLSRSPSKQSSQVLQYRWALEYHHGGIKRRVNEEMKAIKRSYSTARYCLVWSSHSKTWREIKISRNWPGWVNHWCSSNIATLISSTRHNTSQHDMAQRIMCFNLSNTGSEINAS